MTTARIKKKLALTTHTTTATKTAGLHLSNLLPLGQAPPASNPAGRAAAAAHGLLSVAPTIAESRVLKTLCSDPNLGLDRLDSGVTVKGSQLRGAADLPPLGIKGRFVAAAAAAGGGSSRKGLQQYAAAAVDDDEGLDHNLSGFSGLKFQGLADQGWEGLRNPLGRTAASRPGAAAAAGSARLAAAANDDDCNDQGSQGGEAGLLMTLLAALKDDDEDA